MPNTPRQVLAEVERLKLLMDDPEFGADAVEEAHELLRNLLHDNVDWATDAMFQGLHSVAMMRVSRANVERERVQVN